MQIDIFKSGYRLSCIADNIRGQAALARENGGDNFSCALDDLAEQIREISWPMLEFSPDVALAVPVKLAVPLKTASQILAERAQEGDGADDEYCEAEGRPFRDIEEYLQAEGTHCITLSAKCLKIGPRTLVQVLIDAGWIYRDQHYRLAVNGEAIANGLMDKKCRLTTKGKVEIAKLLGIDPNILI